MHTIIYYAYDNIEKFLCTDAYNLKEHLSIALRCSQLTIVIPNFLYR